MNAHDERELERLRWRCRRGLLELDLVLQRFVQRHLARLDADQRRSFAELLAWTDNELLDAVMGRAEAENPQQQRILRLLREQQ